MGKRGRKPNTERKGYFYEAEEQAVVDYINANTFDKKNEIFEEFLKPALKKMIESIIRRYDLYLEGEEFRETFDDTLTFVITKIDRYKQENGRAYSYIGTMCKNYLICRRNEAKKKIDRTTSFDEFMNEHVDYCEDEYVYDMTDSYESTINEIILTTASNIENMLTSGLKLTKNERKVGGVLYAMLNNMDIVFPDLGSNKFNKDIVLLHLRENTNLPLKDIRNCMKKFKFMYFRTKNSIL